MRDNQFSTGEVSDGTLKLRVVDLGAERPCDNFDKIGKHHPDTQYVAGCIASKNRQECCSRQRNSLLINSVINGGITLWRIRNPQTLSAILDRLRKAGLPE